MTRAALLACLLCAACQSEAPGETVTPGGGPRIVSLAPHLTELVFSAGAGGQLVGVMAFSDYPPAAQRVARVGDAFRVDEEALAALAPDLILAWQGGNPDALIEDLRAQGYRVETFAVGTLEQVADNLRRIGRLTGRAADADARADAFVAELQALRERHGGARVLSVFFQTSPQPIYTVNGEHAISEALTLCGGRNVFETLPTRSASVSEEAVIAADPQVLMASGDARALDRWRAHDGLRAVAAGRLYTIDPDLITRDSLRILDGVRRICGHLAVARAG